MDDEKPKGRTRNQKFLLVASILNIFVALLVAYSAIDLFLYASEYVASAGTGDAAAAEFNYDIIASTALFIIIGALALAQAILEIVTSISGIRTSKNAANVDATWRRAIITVDLAAIMTIVYFLAYPASFGLPLLLISLACAIFVFYHANKIRPKVLQEPSAGPFRTKVFELVEGRGPVAKTYGVVMIGVIATSLLPLCFKEDFLAIDIVEYVCVAVFIIDYAMRLSTADMKIKRGRDSFLMYPATPMAIIDLFSILPTFLAINPSLKTLRIVRLIRVIRVFKVFRYVDTANAITRVLLKQLKPLLVIEMQVLGYIVVCALIVFNVEPQTFDTFFDAMYWAVISLTTVGYGDLYPVTDIGRTMSMISSFVGVAMIALPAGIITAGLVDELRNERAKRDEEQHRLLLEEAIEELKRRQAQEALAANSGQENSAAETPRANE